MRPNSETISKAYQNLPDNIRNAVDNFNWDEEVLSIAHEYHIQMDEIDIFQQETMLVVLGLTKAKDYQRNLVQYMNISSSLAQDLVDEANHRIFKELQKRAFGGGNNVHKEIHSELQQEGIELLDSDEDDHSSHQDTENHDVDRENEQTQIQQSYLEEVSDDDYIGIGGHRINTELHSDKRKTTKQSKYLDHTLYTSHHVSNHDSIDVSPEDKDQIKEDGDFLHHINNATKK